VVVGEPRFDGQVARERKDKVVGQLHKGLSGLMKARNVDIVEGYGTLAGPGRVQVNGTTLDGRNVIVATGSAPRSIPGYDFDGERIVSSDHALDWQQQPERVAVIGAGAIGCEFASMLSDLGSEVHLFELVDQILPGTDADVAKHLERALRRRNVQITTGAEVGPPMLGDKAVTVTSGDTSVEVDVVLVSVGRMPLTEGIGLETTAAEVERGYVKADLTTMQTAQPGLYAVGDLVAGTPQLAHAGFAEGISAISHIATGTPAPVDYRAIPLVVYSRPEVATVGLSAAQAEAAGFTIAETSHSFGGAGRAIILGQTMGAVKVISQEDGPILGAAIAGPLAGELIHELMYAVAWEAMPAEAAAFIHAHPTVAEAVGETLLAAAGKSLH
jgi:dihydrolipoamide dehydrogenase